MNVWVTGIRNSSEKHGFPGFLWSCLTPDRPPNNLGTARKGWPCPFTHYFEKETALIGFEMICARIRDNLITVQTAIYNSPTKVGDYILSS